MADFDDSADPELGAACNRLAAYVLPIPEGAVIDEASGLTETDMVMILRKLHQVRKTVMIEHMSLDEMHRRYGPTAQRVQASSDADLLAEWKASSWEEGDETADALAAEMKRRNLDF